MLGFNYKKAVQALDLLAIKAGGTLNKMKAIKIIWLSDRMHLRKYGRTITGDEYFAMKNGPVPSGTKDILQHSDFLSDTAKDYASEYITEVDVYNYKSLIAPEMDEFSDSDLDIIETVLSNYGGLNHFELSQLSHSFPEWKRFESRLNSHMSSRYTIDQLDFFTNVDDEKGLFSSPKEDVLDAVKEYYLNTKSNEWLFA